MTSSSGNDSNEPSDPAGSGNRWEPTGPHDGSGDETAEQPTTAQPAQEAEPQPEPATASRRSRTAVLRKQAPVAAVGAVFLLGGGVAGYALGHATADGGVNPTGRHATPDGGQPGPGDGVGPGPHGHWQQGPGQGEDGPGSGPDDGQGSNQDDDSGQDTSGTPS